MKDRIKIASQIVNSDNLFKALLVFNENEDLLNGFKFIFATEGEKNIPIVINKRKFSKGASIYNLFSSERLAFLDKKINEQLRQGEAKIKLDYSISLDTQAISYLRPYLNNNQNRLPEDMAEVINFLISEDVNIDPMPYIYENLENINDGSKIDSIAEILKSYEILRTIDLVKFKNDNTIFSMKTQSEINESVRKVLSDMLELKSDMKK
ncbi:hypothetical protein [uncultured Clostridium sp.]|uniref:hypothetical protein n=1 Tax=uncultured Clostridium sp. TaxID=59620 RepID=UPI0025E76A97|nr:hypothetical protein [uncultured Clostridium sp.]